MKPRLALALLLVLLGLALPSVAMPRSQGDGRLQSAYEVLLAAKTVSDNAVGYGATRTKEYDAFETLWLAGKAAVPLATQLCRSGVPAARAYGIILLSGLDELAAKRELPRLEDDSTTVLVLSGCIGMPQTIREIAILATQGGLVITTPKVLAGGERLPVPPRSLPN